MTALPYDPRRGRWIPWVIAGGMLVVVAVNAVLITAAVSTFTGTTQRQTYATGRTFNHVLEDAARQRAMGWTAELRREGGQWLLQAHGRGGAALPTGTTLRGLVVRPVEGTEQPLAFAYQAPGRWSAPADAIAPGLWEARITLVSPSGETWDLRQRLLLP
jgi:nitrogen fixation protein FixH